MVGTDLSVEQVSRRAGYGDPTYFVRFFKRAHSVTPARGGAASEHGRHRTGAQRHSAYGLPRMHLSRTPVNKGKEDAHPPSHPRVARYPRGLRGKQATVYLAQRSLPP